MKKISTLLLTLCLAVLLLPAFSDLAKAAEPIEATGKAGENINYIFDEETGVMTLFGTGATYSVSSDYFSKEDQSKVKKLIIGEGITDIGGYMFNSCTEMTEVNFPESLKTIGFYSFGHCSSLEELTIPDAVTTIGTAFPYCTGLKYVEIGKGLKSLTGASISAANLLSFHVNSKNLYLSDIDGHLYSADHKTLICYSAGQSAETFSIPEGVTTISPYAFTHCAASCALKKIILPSSMTGIGRNAFRACESLEEIEIPEGIVEIADLAFYFCKKLKQITLPESLVTIGEAAFELCGVTSIRIPANTTKIDGSAFRNSGLQAFQVAEDNPVYRSMDKMLYSKNGATLIIVPPAMNLTSYEIPVGVKTIGSFAFRATKMKEVILPDSLETIDVSAFNSSSFESIVIPKGVKSIGKYAFASNSKLTKITIMNPDVTLPDEASVLGTYDTTELAALDRCDGTASTTQKWAEANGRTFTSLGKADHVMGGAVSNGNGTHTYACQNCDYTGTLDCTYTTVAKRAATCTADGNEAGEVCSACGHAKTGAVIPALGHDYKTTEEVITEATCANTGLKKVTTTCTRCTYRQTEQVEIPKTSHNLVTAPAVSPTCTEEGLTEGRYCKDCGFAYKAQEKILAKGHTSSSVESIAEPGGYQKAGVLEYYEVCSVCGYESTPIQIEIPAVSSITLSATKYAYTGSAKKPKVTVKDSEGNLLVEKIDYTLSGSTSGTKIGKYTVKVNFIGAYGGTVSKTFTIVPGKISISKVTAIKGGFKAYWAKQSSTKASGYELQYSTSSKFTSAKTKTITKYSTSYVTISNLSKGKKYYVRVRVYKTVSGKKYYSDYSTAKTVTTKK